MVTGATSGIGKATAAALAGRGAQVVLVARDRCRGEATAAQLAAAGGPAPRLEVADLASAGMSARSRTAWAHWGGSTCW